MRNGKTLTMAWHAMANMYRAPGGTTAFAMTCGCLVKIENKQCLAAALSPGGLSGAIFDALTKHVCPTTNRDVLI